MAASFNRNRFLQAIQHWVADDNQALRVIEKPSFHRLIAIANPLAESCLWKSHTSLREHIIAEYKTFIPLVITHLSRASTLIHISFNNWTSPGNKKAVTGICVHHLNEVGEPEDYLLSLLILLGHHSGANIASIIHLTLRDFKIDGERLGYFVLDNATNNDAAVKIMADKFNFFAPYC